MPVSGTLPIQPRLLQARLPSKPWDCGAQWVLCLHSKDERSEGQRLRGTQGPWAPQLRRERENLTWHWPPRDRGPRALLWSGGWVSGTHLEGLAGLHLAVRQGQRALDQVLEHQKVDVVHAEREVAG